MPKIVLYRFIYDFTTLLDEIYFEVTSIAKSNYQYHANEIVKS